MNISINRDRIQEVYSLTLFGIKIDKHLNFNDHINKLRGKIRKVIPIFIRLKLYYAYACIFTQIFLTIYK